MKTYIAEGIRNGTWGHYYPSEGVICLPAKLHEYICGTEAENIKPSDQFDVKAYRTNPVPSTASS